MPNVRGTLVCEAMADVCLAAGIDRAYGVMGEGSLDWMLAFDAGGGTVHHVRHEAAAVAMADAAARVSGHVTMVAVTSGPGLTQVGTTLSTAQRNGTPLVVLAGDVPAVDLRMGGLQRSDQKGFTESCGAVHRRVGSAATAATDMREALHTAWRDRTPVVLSADIDVQRQPCPALDAADAFAGWPEAEPAAVPDRDEVRRAADLIQHSNRPFLLAGAGARQAGAADLLRRLAARAGAVTGTTMPAKGLLGGDPFHAGVVGGYALRATEELAAGADLLIAVGCSLSEHTTLGGKLAPEAALLHVDTHAASTYWSFGEVQHLRGDAAACAGLLDAELAGRGHHRAGLRTPETAARIARAADEELTDASWPARPGVIDPRVVVRALDRRLPEECVVVVTVGHLWGFPVQLLTGRPGHRYVFPYQFGAIGQGLSAGVGAALGCGLPVVVLEGDGGTLMNVQELDTARRYGADVRLFVMNDGALGAEYHLLRSTGRDPSGSVMPAPSFSGIARGFGVPGFDVRDPGEVDEVMDRVWSAPGPAVVDVHVDRQVLSRRYRTMYPRLARDRATPRRPALRRAADGRGGGQTPR